MNQKEYELITKVLKDRREFLGTIYGVDMAQKITDTYALKFAIELLDYSSFNKDKFMEGLK